MAINFSIEAQAMQRECCLPGAQRDKEDIDDEDGHGAAMLSVKSHVKLYPDVLSNFKSAG